LVTAATTWQTTIDLSTIRRFNRFYGLIGTKIGRRRLLG
jgi:hypothetical protein